MRSLSVKSFFLATFISGGPLRSLYVDHYDDDDDGDDYDADVDGPLKNRKFCVL